MSNGWQMQEDRKGGDSPVIEYPCRWSYKVIGEDETTLREAIAHAAEGSDYHISHSKKSSAGRYVSLNVDVVVDCEELRLKIYHALAGHPSIKIVL